jgi:hypothetical protein
LADMKREQRPESCFRESDKVIILLP